MNVDRCDHVIQLAVLAAGRADDYLDRELGPIHLLKYVYLADLAYAEAHDGASFTGASWRFYHYGPWALEVHERIEPALATIDATKKVVESARYDDDFVRWRKSDDRLFEELERDLPREVVSAVRRAVHAHGNDTAGLLNHVYTTGPMLRSVPGSMLTLQAAEPRESYTVDAAKPTAKQQKKRKARIARAKEEIKKRLAERREARAQQEQAPAPRYDEVFFDGLSWLDELAGEEGNRELQGEAVFDDAVWDSDTRGEPRE